MAYYDDLGGGNSGGGGSGSTTTIIILAAICCCCVVCAGGLFWAYNQGHLDWLLDMFKGTPDDDSLNTQPLTPEEDANGDGIRDSEQLTPEEDADGDGVRDSEQQQPAPGDQTGDRSINSTGKAFMCPEPWVRGVLKYDSGSARCCANTNQSFDDCEDEAIDMSQYNWTEDDVSEMHKFVKGEKGGKIRGPMRVGKCPGPIGKAGKTRADGVTSVMYAEVSSKNKDALGMVQCHPVWKAEAYDKRAGYPVYPQCFNKDGDTKASGDAWMAEYDETNWAKCRDKNSNETVLKWTHDGDANKAAYSDTRKA